MADAKSERKIQASEVEARHRARSLLLEDAGKRRCEGMWLHAMGGPGTELKRRKEAMIKLKERFQPAVSSCGSGNRKPPALQPIYDDVFVNGARQIDAPAGVSPDGLHGDATLLDDVWTSEVRKRGRLP